MSAITTHVLDLALGKPGVGLAVTLEAEADDGSGRFQEIGRGVSDSDGRCRTLIPPGTALVAGRYRLRFDTGAWFAAAGRECFFPEVTLLFTVRDATAPHHVPLLLSPFGYSTYRGS